MKHWPTLIKTKAHRSAEEAEASGDAFFYKGNAVADREAKAAAQIDMPGNDLLRQHSKLGKRAVEVLHQFVSVLVLWPCFAQAVELGKWVSTPKKVAARTKRLRTEHQFKWAPTIHRFVCLTCGKRSKFGKHRSCQPALTMVDSVHTSHRLSVLEHDTTGEVLYFCRVCGAFAQVNVRGLRQVCTGPPEEKTTPWYKKEKLLDGFHPTTRICWGKPRIYVGQLGKELGSPVPICQPAEVATVKLQVSFDEDEADPFAFLEDEMPFLNPRGSPWVAGPDEWDM